MQGKKTVGTWSIDIKVKAWIDTKIANKSEFVNRVLKDAMIEEIMRDARREQRPKCPICTTPMTSIDGNWGCMSIHCGVEG